MGLEVLLYVPNIVGYIRLCLLIISWTTYYSHPWGSILTYGISALLDAVDGYLARKLNQTSAFGAWFDIVIDILGRGMILCRTYHIGFLAASLEWITFVCTHTKGAAWKSTHLHDPWFVRAVMAKNFKTPLGFVAIGGLHILPIWLYCHYHRLLDALQIPIWLQYIGIGMLAAGRALCAAVEGWCIWAHIQYLCSEELNKPRANSVDKDSPSKITSG